MGKRLGFAFLVICVFATGIAGAETIRRDRTSLRPMQRQAALCRRMMGELPSPLTADWPKRKQDAAKVVGHPLNEAEEEALRLAHMVGHRITDGLLGTDGKRPPMAGNYTPAQKAEKYRILRTAFSEPHARTLMERGIAGGEERTALEEAVQRQLKRRGWPGSQIKHFMKGISLENLRLAARELSSTGNTVVYFGTGKRYSPEADGLRDEVTNARVALDFATSMGKHEGFVNIVENVPRKALSGGRMRSGDTAPYEQALEFLQDQAGNSIGSFVTHSVPSKRFKEILESCCKEHIVEMPGRDEWGGIPVRYIRPGYEETVNRLILEAVRAEGATHEVAKR